MREQDYDEFAGLLADVWSLKGQALTGGQKAMLFRALAKYPIAEVRAGLDARLRHPKRGQFLTMPADVIAQIDGIVADDGRPGVEEAWAMAFRATDEAATIVWSGEMSEAFGVARPLLMAGDEVGARMAFKETYTRLITAARYSRTPPNWSVTLGFDNEQRNAVLLPHVQAGRIDSSHMLAAPVGLDDVLALPAPEGECETSRALRLKARERLAEYRAEQAKPRKGASDIDRERTAALKAEAAAKVARYAAANKLADALSINEPHFTPTSTETYV